MQTTKNIRAATIRDAAQIAEIYSYYVNNTVITFELTAPDVKEIEERISNCLASSFEWIVYENNNAILGYAYYGTFKERKAYDYTCETTIYLRRDCIHSGVGTALYGHLMDSLKKSRMAVAVGCIALPNEPSVRLHEKLGFKQCGIFKNVGRKFNSWVDIGYWALDLKQLPEYRPESWY
jgi:phosphinothricin acetyltransferase